MKSFNSIAATAFHPVRCSLPYRSDLVTIQTLTAVWPEARRPTIVRGSFYVPFWRDGQVGLKLVLFPFSPRFGLDNRPTNWTIESVRLAH